MKYTKLSKQLGALCVAVLVFSACDKVKTTAPLGDAGNTFVTILQGGTPTTIIKDPIDFVNKPVTLKKGVIDIRRELASNADLNKTMTIVIKDDTAAVRAANPAYVNFPASFYTLTTSDNVAKVGGMGGTWTFTMKPGEFAKQIYINIPNATVLNPSALYALAFTITTVDAGGKIATAKSILVEIGAKNAYDGAYTLKGRHNRTPYDFPYLTTMHMVTTGASSVIFYWPDVSGPGHPIGTGPDPVADISWYGSAIAPEVTFDPATNYVTNVRNTGGATPIDIYAGAGSGQGRFEPATKTMYVYWRYNANDLRGFMDTLTYIGSR